MLKYLCTVEAWKTVLICMLSASKQKVWPLEVEAMKTNCETASIYHFLWNYFRNIIMVPDKINNAYSYWLLSILKGLTKEGPYLPLLMAQYIRHTSPYARFQRLKLGFWGYMCNWMWSHGEHSTRKIFLSTQWPQIVSSQIHSASEVFLEGLAHGISCDITKVLALNTGHLHFAL